MSSPATVISSGGTDRVSTLELFFDLVFVFTITQITRPGRRCPVNPTHFGERHGLVIIIAIGESVVSVGSAIEQTPVRGLLLLTVMLGVSLCAAMWWTYFDGDDERAEHATGRRQRRGCCQPA